jgi:catechol 2,3-dioxygenase-like lactoylglutathione lyase family enzyme
MGALLVCWNHIKLYARSLGLSHKRRYVTAPTAPVDRPHGSVRAAHDHVVLAPALAVATAEARDLRSHVARKWGSAPSLTTAEGTKSPDPRPARARPWATSATIGATVDAHLILYVEDQERATRFYEAVLGRAPRLEVPGMTEFGLAEHATLGLMPVAGIRKLLGPDLPDPARAAGVPRAELYLVVDDPEAAHARALGAGARQISPLRSRSWGADVSYVLDLDGHVLALARPTAELEW